MKAGTETEAIRQWMPLSTLLLLVCSDCFLQQSLTLCPRMVPPTVSWVVFHIWWQYFHLNKSQDITVRDKLLHTTDTYFVGQPQRYQVLQYFTIHIFNDAFWKVFSMQIYMKSPPQLNSLISSYPVCVLCCSCCNCYHFDRLSLGALALVTIEFTM